MKKLFMIVLFFLPGIGINGEQNAFRVPPYLQNPAPDAMTVLWFTGEPDPGHLTYKDDSGTETTLTSSPFQAEDLTYPDWEITTFFDGNAPAAPYCHRVRLTGLSPETVYTYSVEQNSSQVTASFKTVPGNDSPIRFIVFADSETEPESTGKFAGWYDPAGIDTNRKYPIDQTQGYANNLAVIDSRQPDFIVIAGDLVQHGGEQRDWDEFWSHISDTDGSQSIAARIPVLAGLGNHEYYEGTSLGGYNQPGSERAVSRYLTYFEYPPNEAMHTEQEGRYYRIDYGPVTVITLDVANDSPNRSDKDTNFYLLGEHDTDGGYAPAFSPGSHQYTWLETQLLEAQVRSRFTFVFFHHIPYSVGPHGWPVGDGDRLDNQSGRPVRVLTPLFMRYGVDCVFGGHDEMYERSDLSGTEIKPDGSEADHTIQFYDVGIGGDGLRGPEESLGNPYQKFLAHSDAPELWKKGVLIDGGKHYGHLEVDVTRLADGRWQADIKPVYIFPFITEDGVYTGYERRLYDDAVTLISADADNESVEEAALPSAYSLELPYPNPFNSTVLLRYALPEPADISMSVYDLTGQTIRRLINKEHEAGYYSVEWNGRDETGSPVSSGVYLISLKAGSFSDTSKVTLIK
ncbi:metallophosphoesterase [Candidatus Omnitrophota bacterium]